MFRNDQPEVSQFLEKYPFLITLLAEAHRNIMKYFPKNSQVFLTIDADPEGIDEDQLVASIATDLAPNEATDVLSVFKNNWWLNSLKFAQRKLCFILEPL